MKDARGVRVVAGDEVAFIRNSDCSTFFKFCTVDHIANNKAYLLGIDRGFRKDSIVKVRRQDES